jgi:predicted enzyme related to lactoylglutathione lyase
MTTDQDAAVDFYSKLVGWGTQPFEGSDQPYTIFANGDKPLVGLMDLPPEWVGTNSKPAPIRNRRKDPSCIKEKRR